jgi:hypothetical protein
VVWPVRRDPTGRDGPTPKQARGPSWRRTSRGLHVPAEVDADRPEQRIAEAAGVLPTYGGVTGWAALRWLGSPWFNGSWAGAPLPVPLATGSRAVRSQPGIAVSEERLAPADLQAVDALRLTSAVRAVCFEMRYARNLREAVKVFDMAAYADLVSIDELVAYALAHPGWTGIPQCREAVPYLDENSWSPTEVDMRMIWRLDAELPRPLCNVPIFDRSGRHVGTPDLLDPVAGVVGEYDGALHLAGEQRARDVRRVEAFRAVGLETFTMLSDDLNRRGQMADRMIAARRRALWQPEEARPWTIAPPSWWRPTATVAQRRALNDVDRQRWLRLRLRAG